MAAVMSAASSPATSPPATDMASSNVQNQSPLLSPSTSRRSVQPRPMSHASKNRLSQYSVGSVPSRSRPPSHVFPLYPSSLSYALVRDFAYPPMHPLHYGPLPEASRPASGLATPASEQRRLSDPEGTWEQKMPWDSWPADGFNRGHDIPPIQFGDGPPYSEDEDLQSPVVATRHHRKHKSTSATIQGGRSRTTRDDDGDYMNSPNFDAERGYYISTGGDGSQRYYVGHGGETNGPGGEYVTYPPDQAGHSRAYYYGQQARAFGHEQGTGSEGSSSPSSPGCHDEDQSRYSRDYQFTITSPDEEFHGKAVALFDFERENENELPLVEGQIIWVSYRHGQGWLVAEDPKTQESGLVPEEYVRLLRDIEGGMNSLTSPLAERSASPAVDVDTPTQAEHSGHLGQNPAPGNNANGDRQYPQPVVSMFSTSSQDLKIYRTEHLGIQAGQARPQVVHYHGQRGGSQTNTPTFAQHHDATLLRRESLDTGSRASSEMNHAASKVDQKSTASQPEPTAMDTDR